MPTPSKQNGSASPPPKTPGWSQQLFGWGSSRKPSHVDPSTESTGARISRDRLTPHPNGRRPRTIDTPVAVSFASPTIFDGNQPSTNAIAATASTALADQSPWKTSWKSTSTNVRFSANLKETPPSQSYGPGRRNYNMARSPLRHEPLNLQGRLKRKKMRRPGFLSINRRRHPERPDAAAMSDALQSVLTGNSGSKRSAELANYQAFKPGNERTRRSRLPPNIEQQNAEEAAAVSEVSVVEQPAKRRRVQFNQFKDVAASTPTNRTVENDDAGGGKRKATPYKVAPGSDEDDSEDENENENEDQAVLTPDSGIDSRRRLTLPELPEQNEIVGIDYSEWSSRSEREVLGPPVAGSYTVTEILLPRLYVPEPGYRRRSGLRFRESDIIRPFNNRQARSAQGDTEDNDSAVVPDSKRTKLVSQFKCEFCGHMNNDDESICQECNKARPKKEPIGWGDLFQDQQNMYKCPECSTLNPQWVTICQACEAPRNDISGIADKGASSISDSQPAATGSINSSGFSFRATPAAPETSQPPSARGASNATPGRIGPSGFSFSGAPSSSSQAQLTSDSLPAPASNGTPGFTFNVASGGIASGGFSFSGTPAPASQVSLTTAAEPAVRTSAGGAPTSLQPSAKFSFVPAASDSATSGAPNFGNGAPAPATSTVGSFVFGSNPAVKSGFVFGATSTSGMTSETSSAPVSSALQQQPSTDPFGSNSFGKSTPNAPSPPDSKKAATETSSNRSKSEANDGNAGRSVSAVKLPETNLFPSSVPNHRSSQPAHSFPSLVSKAPAPSNSSLFNFGGQNSSSSTLATSNTAQRLGGMPSNDGDGSQKKKRRGIDSGDNDQVADVNKSTDQSSGGTSLSGGPATSIRGPIFGSYPPAGAPASVAPAPVQFGLPTSAPAPFGSTNDAISAPAPLFGQSLHPNPAPTPNIFGGTATAAPSTSAKTPSTGLLQSSNSSLSRFDSSTTPGSFEDPSAANLSMKSSSNADDAPNPFGSTSPKATVFGSTPAPAAGTFGSTPAPAAFGSTPVPAPFGSTPATATFGSAANQAPFGSTPSLAPFGSTPAPAPFGTLAAPAGPFGSTPAIAAPFGSAPTSTAPFGSTPAPTFGPAAAGQTIAPFGSTAAPSQPFGNLSAPAFGGSNTPAAPGGFAPTPAPGPFMGTSVAGQFGASSAGGFVSGGVFGQQPSATPSQSTMFGGNAFGSGATTPNVEGGFQIGTGGTSSTARSSARGRRIIKARRPGGPRQA